MALTLAELARRAGGTVRGRPEVEIDACATLAAAGPRDIAYVAAAKYRKHLTTTHAGAVVLSALDAPVYAGNALIHDNPALGFARIAALLHPVTGDASGVHPTAVVEPDAEIANSAWIGPRTTIEAGARIGPGAFVGPGCHVGRAATLGSRTRLVAHVYVGHGCAIGDDGLVHPGVVIGADGFGFTKDGERWVKMPQLGCVRIGNNVEIGANTAIDRGALEDTVIEDGVKLDNLIQIAHNVRVGAHTAMAACVGIAGSTIIGRRCMIGGQVGISGHLEIADDVTITAASTVTSSIAHAGAYSSCIKAEPLDRWRRNSVRVHQLDNMAQRLRRLEARLKDVPKGKKS